MAEFLQVRHSESCPRGSDQVYTRCFRLYGRIGRSQGEVDSEPAVHLNQEGAHGNFVGSTGEHHNQFSTASWRGGYFSSRGELYVSQTLVTRTPKYSHRGRFADCEIDPFKPWEQTNQSAHDWLPWTLNETGWWVDGIYSRENTLPTRLPSRGSMRQLQRRSVQGITLRHGVRSANSSFGVSVLSWFQALLFRFSTFLNTSERQKISTDSSFCFVHFDSRKESARRLVRRGQHRHNRLAKYKIAQLQREVIKLVWDKEALDPCVSQIHYVNSPTSSASSKSTKEKSLVPFGFVVRKQSVHRRRSCCKSKHSWTNPWKSMNIWPKRKLLQRNL